MANPAGQPQYQVTPIGTIQNNGQGVFIRLLPAYIPAIQALEGFSHLTVVWWFSKLDGPEMRAVLEAPQPYKTAPEVMGIFATRSPVRPNPLGITAVQVLGIDEKNGVIELAYTDADDGTPVLDIKPYTPSYDRVETPGVPAWCSHWPGSLEESASFDWAVEFNY